jgi:hypothetical protein
LAVGVDNTVGVSVLLGNGDGTFRAAVYYASAGSAGVVVGDFNGDNIADLAVTGGDNFLSFGASVLIGNGDGTFMAPIDYAAGNGPAAIAVGDLNGDGRSDLVVVNSGGNTVSVLLGNPPGGVVRTVTGFEYYENARVGFGQVVTMLAQVFPSTATGTVTFSDGTAPLATVALSAGAATFNIASLAIGSHSLSVTYNGDALDLSSSSPSYNLTVPEGTPKITLTGFPNPSIYGQMVTLTATMASSVATGTITFKDGSTTLGTSTLTGGTAIFSIATLAAGQHSLTAIYSGDSNDAGNTSPIYHQLVKRESHEPPPRR